MKLEKVKFMKKKNIMDLSKKTQYTIFFILLSSVVTVFLTKNHLDVISFPLVLIGVSLGKLALIASS